MLRTRVIPIVLIDGYSVVKTIRFEERRNQGNPITVARVYNTRNVDELILLDIDASKQNRSIDLFTIEEIASECFMPLTVGGGIRNLADIKSALDKGADKVSINTAAIENPNFIEEASAKYGAQCIVGSVDVKKVDERYLLYSKGDILDVDAIEWAQRLEKLGAGEILINAVDLDGMMSGVDMMLIDYMKEKLGVPLIYCGGVGEPRDYIEPIRHGVSAVAAASIFHFTRWTPDGCKREMAASGIPVRILEPLK